MINLNKEDLILQNLYQEITEFCSKYKLSVVPIGKSVIIKNCFRINILERCYQIENVSPEWKNQTSYLTVKNKNNTISYFVDTHDECVCEALRIVDYFNKSKVESLIKEKKEAVLRRAAFDWLCKKKDDGTVVDILKPLTQRTNFVTPAMIKAFPKVSTESGLWNGGYYAGYEIEIRPTKTVLRIVLMIDKYTPESYIERFPNAVHIIGKKFREPTGKNQYYSLTLGSFNVSSGTTEKDVTNLLDSCAEKMRFYEEKLQRV